jgi:uncharacterized membrane protein
MRRSILFFLLFLFIAVLLGGLLTAGEESVRELFLSIADHTSPMLLTLLLVIPLVVIGVTSDLLNKRSQRVREGFDWVTDDEFKGFLHVLRQQKALCLDFKQKLKRWNEWVVPVDFIEKLLRMKELRYYEALLLKGSKFNKSDIDEV